MNKLAYQFNQAFFIITGLILTFLSLNLLINLLGITQTKLAYINGKIYKIRAPISGEIREIKSLTNGVLVEKNQKLYDITNNNISNNDLQYKKLEYESQKSKLANISNYINKISDTSNIENTNIKRTNQLAQLDKILELDKIDNKINSLINVIEIMKKELNSKQIKIEKDQLIYEREKDIDFQEIIPQTQIQKNYYNLQEDKNDLATKQTEIYGKEKELNDARKLKENTINFYKKKEILIKKQKNEATEYKEKIDSLRNEKKLIMIQMKETYNTIKVLEKSLAEKKNYTIKSPSSGIVWKVYTQDREYVKDSQELISISDCSHIWIDAFIDINSLNKIDSNSIPKIIIDLDNSKRVKVQGKIESIRNNVNTITELEDNTTLKVDELNGQQYAHIIITSDELNKLLPKIKRNKDYCRIGNFVQIEIDNNKNIFDLFKNSFKWVSN